MRKGPAVLNSSRLPAAGTMTTGATTAAGGEAAAADAATAGGGAMASTAGAATVGGVTEKVDILSFAHSELAKHMGVLPIAWGVLNHRPLPPTCTGRG